MSGTRPTGLSDAGHEAVRQHLQPVIDAAGVLIVGLDTQGRITLFNRRCSELTGYSEEEVLGRVLWDFLLPEEWIRPVRETFSNLRAGDFPSEFASPWLTKDGEQRPIHWRNSAIVNSEGQVETIISVGLDITAQRQVARALRESEESYRKLFEDSRDAICIITREGTFSDANAAALDLFGYAKEEITGLEIGQICASPADFEELQRHVERDGYVRDYELKLTKKNGTEMDCLLTVSLRRSESGNILGYQGIIRDITERKRAEEALRENQANLLALIENTKDAVWSVDTEHRFIAVNSAFKELFSAIYPVEPAPGMSALDGLPGAKRAVWAELHERALKGEPFSVEQHHEISGRSVDYEMSCSPIIANDGEVTGVAYVARDITQRKQTEDQQRLAAIGRLAAGVAHEFNNLLATMSGRAELAQALDTQEAHTKLIEAVLAATARGAETTANLLRFACPAEPTREPILIEGPLDAALALAARELEKARVEVTRNYDTHDKRVLGDRGQLQQVFLDLIANACRAMPDGGTLDAATTCVSQEGGPGQVVVTTSDTGVGVPLEELPRLFEPSFANDRHPRAAQRVGAISELSVSHGIITAHGGAIRAFARPGGGRTFEVRLNVHDEAVEGLTSSQERPQDLQRAASPPRNVLLDE